MEKHKNQSSDSLLVKLLITGNEEAFRKLYLKYKDDLYAFSLSMLKTPAYAEEIVQEVFLKVWLNREELRVDLSFKSFLFTIARNLTFNFLNKASNERDLHKEIFYKAQKASNSTDEIIDDADYNILKREAIDSLPPKRKIIFEKSRFEGQSYEEISDELGISMSTVKNQMSKALASIRNYLEVNSDVTTFMILLFSIWQDL